MTVLEEVKHLGISIEGINIPCGWPFSKGAGKAALWISDLKFNHPGQATINLYKLLSNPLLNLGTISDVSAIRILDKEIFKDHMHITFLPAEGWKEHLSHIFTVGEGQYEAQAKVWYLKCGKYYCHCGMLGHEIAQCSRPHPHCEKHSREAIHAPQQCHWALISQCQLKSVLTHVLPSLCILPAPSSYQPPPSDSMVDTTITESDVDLHPSKCLHAQSSIVDIFMDAMDDNRDHV